MNGASEKRVVFDFEIEFTNGGGIQGQDFRLDIPGDTITDAELIEHLVRDMRLLMVGQARILNQRVIVEAHKQKTIDGEPARDDALPATATATSMDSSRAD